MSRKLYLKSKPKQLKRNLRLLGLTLLFLGCASLLYIFFPLISWHVYFGPLSTSDALTTPIPKVHFVTSENIGSFISQAGSSLLGIDYTNANNWFPTFRGSPKKNAKVPSYFLSIPKIHIEKAVVSTEDLDLTNHLINYPGTALPAESGNAVIFGHSTLPQLFNPKDYKTIFANLYKLQVGDTVEASVNGVTYKHTVFSITVVDPNDTTAFAQTYDTSYLTLVTCTPPGTIWKRLIVKARLEKI